VLIARFWLRRARTLAQAIINDYILLSIRDNCRDRTLMKILFFTFDAVNWYLRRHVIKVYERFKY
jgi:hypothetical protein